MPRYNAQLCFASNIKKGNALTKCMIELGEVKPQKISDIALISRSKKSDTFIY
jgi:hypothetical protein